MSTATNCRMPLAAWSLQPTVANDPDCWLQ